MKAEKNRSWMLLECDDMKDIDTNKKLCSFLESKLVIAPIPHPASKPLLSSDIFNKLIMSFIKDSLNFVRHS